MESLIGTLHLPLSKLLVLPYHTFYAITSGPDSLLASATMRLPSIQWKSLLLTDQDITVTMNHINVSIPKCNLGYVGKY